MSKSPCLGLCLAIILPQFIWNPWQWALEGPLWSAHMKWFSLWQALSFSFVWGSSFTRRHCRTHRWIHFRTKQAFRRLEGSWGTAVRSELDLFSGLQATRSCCLTWERHLSWGLWVPACLHSVSMCWMGTISRWDFRCYALMAHLHTYIPVLKYRIQRCIKGSNLLLL